MRAAGLLLVFLAAAKVPSPDFRYQAGWLGGDVAYSIPFGGGRSLWLFGDTFVGGPHAKARSADSMPRNSIGISQCSAAHCTMKYFWRGMYGPHPRAFFDLPGDNWFWPLEGFVANDALYVVLEEMRAEGTGAFGFDYSGVTLAAIRNYHESPSEWKIEYQKVLTGNRAIPGVAVVAEGAWVYFFTLDKPRSRVALTRLPVAELGHAAQTAGRWQYLSTGSGWSAWTEPGSLPADARTMFHDGYTEFTVRYHPERRQWVAVAPAIAMTQARAVYSVAPAMDGPWSEPQTLFEYPEMKKTSPDYTPHVFCYAAKEHPELEGAGRLVVTYACNSTVEPEIFRNMRLYHPVFVDREAPR